MTIAFNSRLPFTGGGKLSPAKRRFAASCRWAAVGMAGGKGRNGKVRRFIIQ